MLFPTVSSHGPPVIIIGAGNRVGVRIGVADGCVDIPQAVMLHENTKKNTSNFFKRKELLQTWPAIVAFMGFSYYEY
jgi:hypothetical protein